MDNRPHADSCSPDRAARAGAHPPRRRRRGRSRAAVAPQHRAARPLSLPASGRAGADQRHVGRRDQRRVVRRRRGSRGGGGHRLRAARGVTDHARGPGRGVPSNPARARRDLGGRALHGGHPSGRVHPRGVPGARPGRHDPPRRGAGVGRVPRHRRQRRASGDPARSRPAPGGGRPDRAPARARGCRARSRAAARGGPRSRETAATPGAGARRRHRLPVPGRRRRRRRRCAGVSSALSGPLPRRARLAPTGLQLPEPRRGEATGGPRHRAAVRRRGARHGAGRTASRG